MEPVSPIRQVAAVLKCPKCGSTELEQPPSLVPAINPHASTHGLGLTHLPQPLAANPDANVRCVHCDSRWHESDVYTAGERFTYLQKEYRNRAA